MYKIVSTERTLGKPTHYPDEQTTHFLVDDDTFPRSIPIESFSSKGQFPIPSTLSTIANSLNHSTGALGEEDWAIHIANHDILRQQKSEKDSNYSTKVYD